MDKIIYFPNFLSCWISCSTIRMLKSCWLEPPALFSSTLEHTLISLWILGWFLSFYFLSFYFGISSRHSEWWPDGLNYACLQFGSGYCCINVAYHSEYRWILDYYGLPKLSKPLLFSDKARFYFACICLHRLPFDWRMFALW